MSSNSSIQNHSQCDYRVSRKYSKFHGSLIELVKALQQMEPAVGAVDEVEFVQRGNRAIRMYCKYRPFKVVVTEGRQRFVLLMEALPDAAITTSEGSQL